MKTSEDLFILIKSLNKTEKGYFKKFSSFHVRGEKNNYVKLFEAIEKQTQYDEDKILAQFENEPFTNNFSVAKKYLYNLLLKSMRSYKMADSIETELKESIKDIKFLIEKGLYVQCEKLLLKSKELALKYEKHLIILELLEYENLLMVKQSFYKNTQKDIDNHYKETFHFLDIYGNKKEYSILQTKLFMEYAQNGMGRNTKENNSVRKIINHPLMRDESKALSYEARHQYYQSHLFYSFNQNLHHKIVDHCKKLIDHIEKSPHKIKENPETYVYVSLNLIATYILNKQYNEASKSIAKLSQLEVGSEKLKNILFYHLCNSEAIICLELGYFDKAANRLKRMEQNPEALEMAYLDKSVEIIFFLNAAYIYFGLGNYRKAKYYLNNLVNTTSPDMRIDMQVTAKLITIIIQFELGDIDLLEYSIKSIYRFLHKKNRLFKFETLILNFIRKQAKKQHTDSENIKSFKELKIQFEKIAKDPLENAPFQTFDFISWLDSKIEKKPFAEVVRKKGEAFYKGELLFK